jgi:hypothetical protein
MTIEATETEATDQPVFRGTPDDWWEQAAPILESEAANRVLGDWYITQVRTAGNTKPGYRLSTPSKPFNLDQLKKAMGPHDKVSDRVRVLIRTRTRIPEWMGSEFVLANMEEGSTERAPWRRNNNGRWQRLKAGMISVNDHTMSNLNPKPATFS